MPKFLNPKTIADPLGHYTHGVEVPGNARLLFVSGQVAHPKNNMIPPTIEAQTEVVWKNIGAILAEAGMAVSDICKMNTYLTRFEDFPAYAAGRKKYLGSHRPASTSVVLSSLASPDYLVEVEVVAARAAPAKRAARPKAPARGKTLGGRAR